MAAGKVPHVYFGPKDINGEALPEPVYIHQDWPKCLYHKTKAPDGMVFASEAEVLDLALDSDWVDSPAKFGVVSAPSQEQLRAQKLGTLGLPKK